MATRMQPFQFVVFVLAIVLVGWNSSAHGQMPGPPLPHDPAHAEQATTWCALHLARREIVAALSDCDYAVARDPKDVAALSNRGAVWLLAGDPKRAIVDFDAALALKPEDAGLHFNRGLAHDNAGFPDRAIADYSAAIGLNPQMAIAFHNRGAVYERTSRRRLAVDDYTRALAINPTLQASRDALRRLQGADM